MAIIQEDIAKKLKLSVATVSRSLRNDRSINPDTRAKVLQTASQMGYQTRPSAGLRHRPRNVGVGKDVKPICILIQSDLRIAEEHQAKESLVAHRILSGITEAAGDLHTHAIIHYIKRKDRDHADDPKILPAVLRNNRVSGLIIMHYYPNDVVERLSNRYPCVSLHAQYQVGKCDCIAVDSVDAVGRLVDRLARAGHEHIGFLSVGNDFSWNRHRFCGYMDGLVRNNLPYDPQNTVTISQLQEDWSDVEKVRGRIDAGVRAWVCSNDWVGYGLMERLAEWDLRVPEDVAVTGFDDYPAPNGLKKLTSVNAPEEFIGFSAVRSLLGRAEHPNRPREIILVEGNIVDGQSIAPPKR